MTNDLRSMQDMFNGTPTVPFKEGGSYQTALEKLRIELTELNARIEDRNAALLSKTVELSECQKQRDELLAALQKIASKCNLDMHGDDGSLGGYAFGIWQTANAAIANIKEPK